MLHSYAIWPLLLALAGCGGLFDKGANREALVQVEIESTQLMHWAARARSAVPGDNEALVRIAEADAAIAQAIENLQVRRDALAESWKRSGHTWEETHRQVQAALTASSRFERDGEIQDQILATLPRLQAGLTTLAVREVEAAAPDAKTLFSLMQSTHVLERVPGRLTRALAGAEDAISAVDSLSRDIAYFGNTLHRLRHGEAGPEPADPGKSAPQPELDALIEGAKPLFSAIDEFMEHATTRFEAMDALARVESEAEALARHANRVRRFSP